MIRIIRANLISGAAVLFISFAFGLASYGSTEYTSPPPQVTPPTAPATMSDRSFANAVAQDGMMEIQAADLALTRSQNRQIRALAQRLKTDHTAANQELQTIASSHQIPLSATLDAAHVQMLDALRKAPAADFERSYQQAMVEGHQAAVKKFQLARDNHGLQADLKQFADQTLPTLQSHLSMAQAASSGDQ